MAIELANAYISLSAETSKIPLQISSAVDKGAKGAEGTGKGIGSKLAGGIGSTLKGGALAVGAIAGAALGTALTQGMGRLVAIDDAKGKLAGLGHSAESVSTIMESALKSVQGTAFGLGDAATIAASAVAAGIKPGEELTKYLSLTGDAATIAGTSLEDMGSIFNKVQTSGSAFTDNLNQLSDKGIPIFQYLQEEYGVSADALKKMVKEGKVDSETFKKVLQENLGGAGLESGKTLRGSYENMKAALGRLGAGAIEPFLPIIKNGLGKVLEFADKVTPAVKRAASGVSSGLFDMGRAFNSSGADIDGQGNKMQRAGVFLRKFTDGVQGVYSILAKGDFKGAKMTFGLEEDSKVVDYLFRLRDGAISLYDVIRSPSGNKFGALLDSIRGGSESASSGLDKVNAVAGAFTGSIKAIGAAAAGAGVGVLSILGSSATVASTGIGLLASVMGFLADHTSVAAAGLIGLAVAFTVSQAAATAGNIARVAQAIAIPATLASQRALTTAVTQHTVALRANTLASGGQDVATTKGIIGRTREAIATRAAATANGIRTAALNGETTALARYAAAQRLAAGSSGALVGGLRNGAATVATLGAKAQGVGAAGMGALRTGMGKVASFATSGGGLALGITAAIGLFAAMKSSVSGTNKAFDESRAAAGKYAATITEFRTGLDEAFNQSNGATDRGVKSVVAAQIQKIDEDLDAAASRIPGKFDKISSFVLSDNVFTSQTKPGELEDAGKAAQRAHAALDKLGLSQKDVTTGVTGSATAYGEFQQKLLSAGKSSEGLVEKYARVRKEFVDSQSSASQVKDAFAEISSKSIGAAGGVDALTGALGRLRGDQLTAEESQKAVNDALRAFKDASAEGALATVDATGKIDTTTAAGSRLFDAMKGVATAFDQAGAEAARSASDQKLSATDAAAFIEAAGIRVRDEFVRQQIEAGATEQQANALADQYRLFPTELPTKITLDTGDAVTKLTGLKALLADVVANLNAPTSVPAPSLPNVPRNGALPLPGQMVGGLAGFETGGRLPRTGPGSNKRDGIVGVTLNHPRFDAASF